jgi:uncharacterized protein (DUF2384 family)
MLRDLFHMKPQLPAPFMGINQELMAEAVRVLKDDEEARIWFVTQNRDLRGATPRSLLNTSYGVSVIRNLLKIMEDRHG